MLKILIIEDDLLMLDVINIIISEYSHIFEINVINPREYTLDSILQDIAFNNYDYLFLDHNYNLPFTGKDIAAKSNFSRYIYSISGGNTDIEYSNEHIGKLSISFFNKFSKLYIQSQSYA
jgi:hypothetical protein